MGNLTGLPKRIAKLKGPLKGIAITQLGAGRHVLTNGLYKGMERAVYMSAGKVIPL